MENLIIIPSCLLVIKESAMFYRKRQKGKDRYQIASADRSVLTHQTTAIYL